MPADAFQFNAKNVFLTYPKAEFPLSGFLAWARELPNISYICVSSENHQDGTLHRHALLQFTKPFRTRSQQAFDFENSHPNIQAARNPSSVRTYVQKDGSFEEWGTFLEGRTSINQAPTVSADNIQEQATNMELGPFLVWASVNRVMYARDIWHAFHRVDVNTIENDDGLYTVVDDAFLALMKDRHPTIPGNKAILVVGASGIGKTVYAKLSAPKPALFVSHTDTLREFRPGYHKSIIFDDITFTHTPITNQIAICDFDNPRAIHCRHRVAQIPAGVHKIFTCNEMPLNIEHEAIRRRVYLIRCDHGALNLY
jgi:hypothetical protein